MGTSYELIRAARGPILLIVVGVLFAIDHASSLDIRETAPIIVIVYGLLKLAERMMAPPVVYPPPSTYPPPPQQPSAGDWK